MSAPVFDTGHLAKTYFKMSLPVVFGLVITIIYNLADTFFIGQTGNTDLVAGVSLCSPVFTTLMAFGNIYGQGGSSLISRLIGKEDREHVHQVSSLCFYLAILTGIVMAVLMVGFHRPLLFLIGADEETIVYAKDYFLIMAGGAPLVILTFIHSNLIRCEGMATTSMVGSMMGTVLNIILDPILISVCGLGAAGAAIATILGYLLTDLFFLIIVLKKSRWMSVKVRDAVVKADDLRQIFGIGITAAITNLMQSMCVIVMNHFLLTYGNEKIAAMGIVLKVNMIGQLVLTGFAFGAVPLFGFLYGSRNQEKLSELMRFSLKFLTGLSLVLTAGIFLSAPQLMRAMMDEASIVADGTVMLRWQVVGTVFAAIVLLMTCLFQASGKVIPAFLMSISRQGVLFVVVLVIAVKALGYNGILMSQTLADAAGAALGLGLYKRVFK